MGNRICGNFYSRPYETTSSDSIMIANRGVRLKVLQKISDDLKAGRLQLPADNKKRSFGEQIVDGLVKPVTNSRKCSYATYLYEDPNTKDLVGKCNTFLSHPWSADFEITVAALSEYERTLPKGSPPKFYFVDYFAVNQHNASADLKQLEDLVRLSDTLVLMAEPWSNPEALTRLWCIFEIAHAVLGNTEIEIVLRPEQVIDFQKELRENTEGLWDFVGKMFENIDSQNAKAKYEGDVKNISQFIEKELGGFANVDAMVADGLRNWFLRSANALLENVPDERLSSIEYAKLIYTVAGIHYTQCKYAEAAALYDKATTIFKNNNDKFWVYAEKDKVFMFRKMKKFEEALSLAIQNLQNWEKVEGKTHDGWYCAKRCIGSIQIGLGMNEEAEESLRAALEAFEKSDDQYQIRTTKYQLAEALRNLGRLEEAVEMYQDLINHFTKIHGSDSPSTLNCVLMRARCLALGNSPEVALPLYEAALPVLRINWSDKDPSVIKCKKWIDEARLQLFKLRGPFYPPPPPHF